MKSNQYKVNNFVEKIINGTHTMFLDKKDYMSTISKLKKYDYKVFKAYEDCEKVMLYTGKVPEVSLLRIYAVDNIRHQDVLGSLYALNIDSSYFGDVVLYKDSFYVYVVSKMTDFIKNNLTKIGSYKIRIEEVSVDVLKNYRRNYERLEVITSSTRIDNVISSLIGVSRKIAQDKIIAKDVIVNYEVVNRISLCLKENDVFSIRKHGKYRYLGVVKKTKKDNLIIKIQKYL